MWKVAVCHQPCHLLNNTILNYPLKSPDFHTLSQLQWKALGRDDSRSTTAPPVYWLTYSVFKPTLILNHVITTVDAIVSYISSTSYSYWSSDLNEMTRITPSSNHVPYSVTLSTKGQMIPCLPTRVPFLIPQNTKTWCSTLYYFRSLFNDHRRPIS